MLKFPKWVQSFQGHVDQIDVFAASNEMMVSIII